jgi:hypothetical protein
VRNGFERMMRTIGGSALLLCAALVSAGSSSSPSAAVGFAGDSARCVLENGRVRLADPGEPLSPAAKSWTPAPPPYADTRKWFENQEGIRLRRRRMQFHALPFILLPEERTRFMEYDGVMLYMEVAAAREPYPPIVYAPISPGCTFQPYYYFDESGAVRGE